MIARISRLDPLQVVVAEVGAVGQLEVVVEAVLDDGPDGVLGAGPQTADRLGQDVRSRMAQDVAACLGVGGDDRHLGAVGQRGGQVRPRGRRPWRPRPPWPGGRRWIRPARRPSCPRPPPAPCRRGVRTEMTPAIVHPSPARPAGLLAPDVRMGGRHHGYRTRIVRGRRPSRAAPSATGRPSRGLLVERPQGGRRVEIVVQGAPHGGEPFAIRRRAGAATPALQPRGGSRACRSRCASPSRRGSGGPGAPAARPPAPSPCTGHPRTRGCRATSTSWCRPVRPDRRGTRAARTASR